MYILFTYSILADWILVLASVENKIKFEEIAISTSKSKRVVFRVFLELRNSPPKQEIIPSGVVIEVYCLKQKFLYY